MISVHIYLKSRYKITAESVPYRASESADWFDSGVGVGLIVATICSVLGVGIGYLSGGRIGLIVLVMNVKAVL